MKDDFHVFDEADDDDNRVEPDIALITAYLARELSITQIAAVEQRLDNDPAFRSTVQPLIDAWSLPVARNSVAALPNRTPRLSREHLDAGWARHVAAFGASTASAASAASAASNANVARSRNQTDPLPTRVKRRSTMRIAATITAIVTPIIVAAQLITYSATHTDAPGHSIARNLVPQSWRAPQPFTDQSAHNDREFNGTGDGPVQIAMTPAAEQQKIPVLELSPPTGRTAQKFVAILGVKEAPDGRVLVNDTRKHQIWLFDKSLATGAIVVDSAKGSARTYPEGNVAMPIIPYLGDSVLFVDHIDHQLQMLDGAGQTVRSLALVSNQDIYGFFDGAGVDKNGNLIYQGSPTVTAPGVRRPSVVIPFSAALVPRHCLTLIANSCDEHNPPAPRVPGANSAGRGGLAAAAAALNGVEVRIPPPDTMPVQRADFLNRRVDTIAFLSQPMNFGAYGGGKLKIIYDKDNVAIGVKQMLNPLYFVDEFAVLSDGTIAIVRGNDYHVDWIHPDGTKSSSGKLPYEWKRLTDDDKKKIADSTLADVNAFEAWAIRRENKMPAPGDSIPVVDSLIKATGVGNCGSVGLSVIQCPQLRHRWPYEVVPLAEIPDYYPPFRLNAAIADRDGNLWILPRTTTQSKAGELVYDVVHPRKGFVERVRLPLGRSIAGFAKGGVVYLQFGDLRNGFHLERTIVQRK